VSHRELPKKRALGPSQILVLYRGEEVIAGMGQTADIFLKHEMPGRGNRLWGIKLNRLIMPAEVPPLKGWEEGLVLRLALTGEGVGEVVAADLTYLGAAFGFTVDGHNTVICEQVDFQTRTRPAILGEPITWAGT
jgi:hypothetical protein